MLATTEKTPLIAWLLEDGDPSLQLRTMRELLGAGDSQPEVAVATSSIPGSSQVVGILQKMHPDGYWLQQNSRKDAYVGDDVLYGSFASTHFCLAYLSELSLNRAHPLVERAADRYLDLQKPDGDWLGHYSCLLGYNIRTFIRLGYRDDPRLQRAIDLMLHTIRLDGGYLCDMHERRSKKGHVKSCFRGATKCLLAFSELPEYWDHPRCRQLVDYFLNRGGIYRSRQPGVLVNKDMERFSFPITWRANMWEVLYALSKMGFGNDERLIPAWEALHAKADGSSRYWLDWTPTQSPWKVGWRSQPNKWTTFYILLAEKYKSESQAGSSGDDEYPRGR